MQVHTNGVHGSLYATSNNKFTLFVMRFSVKFEAFFSITTHLKFSEQEIRNCSLKVSVKSRQKPFQNKIISMKLFLYPVRIFPTLLFSRNFCATPNGDKCYF